MTWPRLCLAFLAVPLAAQTPDTTKPYTLPPTTVSVTRADQPLTKVPFAVHEVARAQISRARPTWGLDEALASVPGVFVANRYNFSQDQRISIRGFGARSAFAVRGIKILLDGIPQTLPDGQGQLTNLELGDVDHIEVLRGSSSALFGNASGGVISIWTNPDVAALREDARVVAGQFDGGRAWSKWRSTTGLRVGNGGSASVTVSRLDYEGERDHSAADTRVLNARLRLPLAPAWSLAAAFDVGDDPRADNPGSLTRAELDANRDTVPLLNKNRNAGKAVTQVQTGATVRRALANGGEAVFTVFGLTRDLQNPITTTYIDLNRIDYGMRASIALANVTAGFDVQRLQDDRKNFNYLNTPGDSAKPDTTRALDQLEHVTELGPFVQTTWPLSTHTALTAGLRYDWVKFTVDDRLITPTNPDNSGEKLMQALSGTVGVAVNPSSALTVYGNVGSSFETPTTTELVNSPSGAGGFNSDVGPQRAVNYEIGGRGSLGARVKYTIAVFQADVRDEIVQYAADPTRAYYTNAASARHRGVELSADVTPLPGVDLAAFWTYADYRYRSYTFTDTTAHVLDGRALPGIPNHWLNVMLHVQPGGFHGMWAELQQTYSSDYYVSDLLSTRTAPWWASNIRAGWDGNAGGMRLSPFVAVNNAFNHLYVSSVVINAARDRFYEPAPSRNFYLGLSVGAGH